MRFPHIRDAPVAEAKRQRSVFGFTRFLIASWIYYTLLHPYTVIQYMIIDPEPDLTSTFSISSSISYILKTNFPLIAICFPFLRSLRTYNSSLYSAFSFYKRVFLDVVLSRADPDRSIYRFIKVSRVEEQTILLTSNVASCSLVPSSGELSSRERSRSFGVIIRSRVVGGVEVGI
jgi:hypothetical protein